MNPEQERRYSSRIRLQRQARLDFETTVFEECLIQNLSLTGMFVPGDFQQREGDRCMVNLVQKGKHSRLSFEAAAQVTRKDTIGLAVEFTSMPLESFMLLQMILACGDEAEFSNRGVESLDNLPFTVHDDLR